MKPLDDRIPEEVALQQQELLFMLQRVYRKPAPLTTTEQEQIIKGVRERLLNLPVSLAEEDATVQPPVIEENILPGQSSLPPVGEETLVVARRRTRVFQMLNSLAAVLVIGAIIGASILLFTHRTPSTPGAGTNGTILVARATAGGLEMSLYLTPGPYFLSEMLAADISLTNHTHTNFIVGLPFAASPCGYVPGVEMTGGGAPHYTVPIATQHSCPSSSYGTTLKPGQMLTAHKYLLLGDSGSVTLTTYVEFFTRKVDNRFEFYSAAPNPLSGHLPSIRVNVNSKVPADSQLSFKLQDSHVIVTAPPGAQTHLLYLYGVWCTDAQHPGIGITGNYGWEPISKNQLSVPACGAREVHWTFAFGAPGYAVIYGSHVYS